MPTYLRGLLMGLAYVAPIGTQNLFVIQSAMHETRKRSLLTALIVIFFDVSLSLACFFGIGALMERFPLLQQIILLVGSLIVLWIGFSLVRSRETSLSTEARTSASWLKTAGQICVVTWFNPQAILGGAVGIGVREAMRYGVARGLFSNEAGMGSTPHAHAMAKVEKPQDQGVVAMVCVFIDTFVVLTITALVMITSGALNVGDMAANPAAENMAQVAFSTVFGSFGNFYVAICLLFFAFSTIIGWYFFGEQNVKYLFGVKAVKVYACIAVVCVALGAVLEAPLVWNLSDLFNALMVFPNLIALLALSGLVAKVSREDHELRK